MEKPMNKTTNAAPVELDPVIVLQQLEQIHPMQLSRLVSRCLTILTSITGLACDHALFAPLRTARGWEDLTLLDWTELGQDMAEQGVLSVPACQCAVMSMQIVFERAQVHHQLYRAHSLTTLRLRQPETLLAHSLPELSQLSQEFDQAVYQADGALHAGRALSAQFQRTVEDLVEQFHFGALRGTWWICLQGLLDQMRARYAEYEQMLYTAFEHQGYIQWYLAWVAQTGQADTAQTGERAVHAA
jgi:hypothetical protein